MHHHVPCVRVRLLPPGTRDAVRDVSRHPDRSGRAGRVHPGARGERAARRPRAAGRPVGPGRDAHRAAGLRRARSGAGGHRPRRSGRRRRGRGDGPAGDPRRPRARRARGRPRAAPRAPRAGPPRRGRGARGPGCRGRAAGGGAPTATAARAARPEGARGLRDDRAPEAIAAGIELAGPAGLVQLFAPPRPGAPGAGRPRRRVVPRGADRIDLLGRPRRYAPRAAAVAGRARSIRTWSSRTGSRLPRSITRFALARSAEAMKVVVDISQ